MYIFNVLAFFSCQSNLATGVAGLTLFNISCTEIINVLNFTFYGNFFD